MRPHSFPGTRSPSCCTPGTTSWWPRRESATLAVLLVLPPLLFWSSGAASGALADWLGQGFDADAAMLETDQLRELRGLAGRPLPAIR